MDFKKILCDSFERNGLPCPDDKTTQAFLKFTDYLIDINSHTNLTAIRDIPSIVTKHYIDSLLISDKIPLNSRVLDLGCGPGFPSIPLAIWRSDLQIVSLDSTAKKITFVQDAAKLLDLNNLVAISARAEDRLVMKKLDKFDVVTSRAVANLNVLSELCMPYLKIGGKMLAMKGAKIGEEVSSLLKGKAIEVLGAAEPLIQTWKLVLEEGEEIRGVVEIFKIKECEKQYPRTYAAIVKTPL